MPVETLDRHVTKPLGFDLSLERGKTLQMGDEYAETFFTNARYYARETYARTPTVEYYQEIVGQAGELYFKEGNENYAPAAERVLEPYTNQDMPSWYRARALREYHAIRSLEKHIASIKPGERLVEFSPAPFDVPEALLEGTAFGRHSFVRTYEVVTSQSDSRRLLGKAHLNYLTAETQARLFEELTGQSVEPASLLGTIGVLPPGIDIADIERIIADIPQEGKVDPPAYAPDTIRSAQIERYIQRLDHYLETVFTLMRDPYTSSSEIVGVFQDWETLIAYYAKHGVEYPDPFSPREKAIMLQGDIYARRMRDIRNQPYVAWENSCGGGSGWTGRATHEDLSKALLGESSPKDEWEWKVGNCRPKKDGGCGAQNVLVGPCDICKKCQDAYDKKG